MVQVFIRNLDERTLTVEIAPNSSYAELASVVSKLIDIPASEFKLNYQGYIDARNQNVTFEEGNTYVVSIPLCGGIDFQHREGSKIGSGGQMSESQAALERKERLRKLALETIDITKDPYFLRNHLGSFECKLCLTLHTTEGNYLAHTQGKRHQYNLGRRAAMEAKNAAPRPMVAKEAPVRRMIRIGRPGYKVTKSRDLHTRQRSITFEVDYPEAEEGGQPRHRFMSSYEQKVEAPDKNVQYVLFACEPYETVAFKIPNHPIDKREGRFFTSWNKDTKKFVLQLFFVDGTSQNGR